MLNPYKNVNFENALQIKSMSHTHVYCQKAFDDIVSAGFKHIASTCYLPSVPTYPLKKFFANVPDDVIGSPNSEKVYTLSFGGAGHFCALGSFAMGHGHTEGATATWQTVFDEIIENLQFPDGGGITINHPTAGYFLGIPTYIEMLDHDPRVLGVEIFNRDGGSKDENGNYQPAFFTDVWDELLKTGRRCWGFAVIDWQMPTNNWGSNVLLVPEFTEHACLKAYRDGAFYAQIKDIGLRVSDISVTDKEMSISVNRECEIKFFSAKGCIKTVTGTSATCPITEDDIYIRAEAIELSDRDSHILTNPVMLKI